MNFSKKEECKLSSGKDSSIWKTIFVCHSFHKKTHYSIHFSLNFRRIAKNHNPQNLPLAGHLAKTVSVFKAVSYSRNCFDDLIKYKMAKNEITLWIFVTFTFCLTGNYAQKLDQKAY